MIPNEKVLSESSIGANVKAAKYAIRGEIVELADKLEAKLKTKPEEVQFKKLLQCNIGNPLILGQPAFSFDREVLSVCMNPSLTECKDISADARERAKKILHSVEYPQAMCAYTKSQGLDIVRQSIKEFIQNRDGHPCNIEDIYLANGASDAVTTTFNLLVNGPRDGVMIPIPQYPLYTALISLFNGTVVPYYLDEEHQWGLQIDDIAANYKHAKDLGLNVKAIVVINPGNPTGQVLSKKNIEDVIKFCYEHKMVILADEVYQANIYKAEKPFYSFKKIMMDLGAPYNQLELISYHSTSKGLTGECGIRGGYAELVNIDPYVKAQFLKLRSIILCPNTPGQIMAELMVNPPKDGVNSKEIVARHNEEKVKIFDGLKSRAKLLTDKLNKIPGITCNEMEGAMYAFPRIHLTKSAIEAAKKKNMAPDLMYCMDALEATGIMIVAGSGFRQKEGTYHFRITNLIYNAAEFEAALEKFAKFNKEFFAKYP